MARTSAWRSAALAALVAMVVGAGCTEKLTTPGRCPALCPAVATELADTLLVAADSSDTSARGYVQVSDAVFLAASTLDSLKSVIVLRFSPVPDRWAQTTTDTVLAASPPDSVQCALQVAWHDSTVHPRLVFYRLPATLDTTMTYAQLQPYFADSLVVDTAAVPDTGIMLFTMPASVVPPPADSGVVALGVKVVADAPTVVGITSGVNGTSAPSLSFFVHGQPPRDSLTRNLVVAPTFASFAQSPLPGVPPAGVLAVGGLPSAHSLLRLAVPKVAIDSAGVVRATLLLNIVRPVVTLPNDSFAITAYPLLRDYGPKSVLYPDSTKSGQAIVHAGQTGWLGLDIARILRLWGTAAGDSLPRTIVIGVFGEGNTFGEVDLWGRLGLGTPPQLRVTYVKKYELGVP
jgi:hypothetical protein